MTVLNDPLNILLVGDGKEDRELISKRFELYGNMRLWAAESLEEARTILSQSNPDLAIVDYEMPDGKGIDILKAKRRKKYPVVLMTDRDDEDKAVNALKSGAFEYIIKSSDTLHNLPRIAERAFLKWEQVNHRKKSEEKLKRQYEQLQKINKELDHLVYSTAHDLRGPLLSVLGLINISRGESAGPSQLKYLDMMEKCIKKLDEHVVNISNYSKNNRLELKVTEVNPNRMISEVIQNHSFLENFSRIRMDIKIQNTYPLYTDESRLRTILGNLVFNAINYHDYDQKDPFIMIHFIVGKNKYQIDITDNGRGIAPFHLDKIFEMFYRGTEASQGSGLGLYIVKETVNKLKGKIRVRSFLKTGSRFTVVIPNRSTD